LTFPDALIVLHSDFDHLSGNSSVQGLLWRANEGIVGPNIRFLGEVLGSAKHS
jgi:hypothetical protein